MRVKRNTFNDTEWALYKPPGGAGGGQPLRDRGLSAPDGMLKPQDESVPPVPRYAASPQATQDA
jgi:hypothetical protein